MQSSAPRRCSRPSIRPSLKQQPSEYVPWVLDERGGHHFILQGQLRHTFRRGKNWNWHATYGGSFFTKYNRTDEVRVQQQDGSGLVFPEQHSLRIEMGAVHVGIGAEHPISRRVAIRWDAQAVLSVNELNYPIPRGTIGITWR
ncbi:MAG TPA: hypothetical protein VES67_13140 [Vicinamibacterales bacterium]|nr:hypothetical protein [Vicinamibacterales bacterium]